MNVFSNKIYNHTDHSKDYCKSFQSQCSTEYTCEKLFKILKTLFDNLSVTDQEHNYGDCRKTNAGS